MACNYKRATKNSGPRGSNPVLWVVLHSTEAPLSAAQIASYFASSSAGGSTQKVVDEYECWRCVPDDEICWGAVGANTNGQHLEFCAYAGWKKTDWLRPNRRRMLKRGAYQVAVWCNKYDIPVRYVYAAGLRARIKGITFHYEVEKAFPSTGHSDPGPNFPRRTFLRMVKRARKALS